MYSVGVQCFFAVLTDCVLAISVFCMQLSCMNADDLIFRFKNLKTKSRAAYFQRKQIKVIDQVVILNAKEHLLSLKKN